MGQVCRPNDQCLKALLANQLGDFFSNLEGLITRGYPEGKNTGIGEKILNDGQLQLDRIVRAVEKGGLFHKTEGFRKLGSKGLINLKIPKGGLPLTFYHHDVITCGPEMHAKYDNRFRG